MQVQNELDRFNSQRIQVVAIGQGSGQEARLYAEKWGVEFPVLGDPKRAAYKAFGLLGSNWTNLFWSPLLREPRLTLSRLAAADFGGSVLKASDPLQLGGVAILDRQGIVQYLHRAQTADDNPSNDAVLEAARSCTS